MRIRNWTKRNAKSLWTAWRAQFDTEEEAIAVAVWVGNRLIKNSTSRATRRTFYSIKDAWLVRQQEVVGRRVRLEKSECWRCEGSGCDRCDWSGVYRERWLYQHEFHVADQVYRFHSYREPAVLLDEMAEDREAFGSKFTEAEMADLALPMSGMVKLLTYVAAARWGMRWNGERYEENAISAERPLTPTSVRYCWVQQEAT